MCTADPICCELDWDQVCIDIQEEACAGLACPGAQPCDSASDVTGCADQVCCRTMCDHDWYCCYIEWDQYCVDFAARICGQVACELVIPDVAVPESEPCDERLNDGCNMLEPTFSEIVCGQLVSGETTTSSPRDTDWYQFTTTQPTLLTFTLESEFPAQAVLFGGPCSGPFEVLLLFDSTLCAPAVQQSIEVGPGTWSMVIGAGREEISLRRGLQCPLVKLDEGEDPQPIYFGARYLLGLDCDPEPCTQDSDLNGDGLVNGADLTILLAGWGKGGGPEDIDCSGSVDGADLTRLLADWAG
ncbi:MAG: hypothetical protein VX641_02235 [Planctomycetota bacterium]|nr:hypothetical protein [Planctomycetota bacterium]